MLSRPPCVYKAVISCMNSTAQDLFIVFIMSLIARFMGPTWGPSGTDRTQMGSMLAPWTLLSEVWTVELCSQSYQWYLQDHCAGTQAITYSNNPEEYGKYIYKSERSGNKCNLSGHFNINFLSYQYRKYQWGDETVQILSYFHNGNLILVIWHLYIRWFWYKDAILSALITLITKDLLVFLYWDLPLDCYGLFSSHIVWHSGRS